MEKKLITENDTIYDIVTRYPEVKERLLELSPRYERLNNPALFQTVARITTVKKAAMMGNIYLREMLYQLNDAIGLGEVFLKQEKEATKGISLAMGSVEVLPQPSWWEKRQDFVRLDVRGKSHPFHEITAEVEKLQPGEGLMVFQDFVPYPLIDYFTQQGYETYYEKDGDGVVIGIYKKEADYGRD